MNWLNKEMMISVLTLVDTQKEAYAKFMEEYDDTALAHTEILMKSIEGLAKGGEAVMYQRRRRECWCSSIEIWYNIIRRRNAHWQL